MHTAAKNSQVALINKVQGSPVIRSLCVNSTRTEDTAAQRNGLTAGHIMIGLTLHAADQPDATPETRALAQRLRARHPATNIGE